MATDTATIRVARVTRDRLAEHARRHGTSVSAMLAEFAHSIERDEIYRAEREATLEDAGEATVTDEEHDWAMAAGDGIG